MASGVTNYAEIQQDEIDVLRSIYMEDFVEDEAKRGPWNKVADRSFRIYLKTHNKHESHIAVILFVSFPPTYPKTVPRMRVEFGNQVRKHVRMQVSDAATLKPKQLVGSEMVYEITTLIQDIIDNAPNVGSENVPTLDEERSLREHAAMEKALKEDEKRRLEVAQENHDEERQMLLELVSQERERAYQRKLHKVTSSTNPMSNQESIPGVLVFDRPSQISHSGKSSEIWAVHSKVLFREGFLGTISTVQQWENMDSKDYDRALRAQQPPFLVLKDIFIPDLDDERSGNAMRELESLLEQQVWVHKPHPNILGVANYLVQPTRGENTSISQGERGWNVSILMQLASKGSLQTLLETAGQLEIKRLRMWSLQILEGLHHYHRHGAAHGDVHLRNILLEEGEAKNVIAKLADGGYANLLHLLRGNKPHLLPVPWTTPEDHKNGPSPPGDIWHFGVCLLQMGFGADIVDEYRSPNALIEDLRLSKSFEATVRKIFSSNPKKRPAAWDLLHFEFFRNDEPLSQGPSGDFDLSSTIDLSRAPSRRSRRQSSHLPSSSRYSKEFVEDGRLGRGGFGEVFRARNRIDGQPYAIKKIKAKSKAALDPVLSEATVLSRLNHPHVVRYYTSWIEDTISNVSEDETNSSFEGFSSLSQFDRRAMLPQSSRVSLSQI